MPERRKERRERQEIVKGNRERHSDGNSNDKAVRIYRMDGATGGEAR